MTDTPLADELREILESVLGVQLPEDGSAATMDDLETWDSMAHISLILAVEQRFRIQLTPDEASVITSLESLRDVVGSKR